MIQCLCLEFSLQEKDRWYSAEPLESNVSKILHKGGSNHLPFSDPLILLFEIEFWTKRTTSELGMVNGSAVTTIKIHITFFQIYWRGNRAEQKCGVRKGRTIACICMTACQSWFSRGGAVIYNWHSKIKNASIKLTSGDSKEI